MPRFETYPGALSPGERKRLTSLGDARSDQFSRHFGGSDSSGAEKTGKNQGIPRQEAIFPVCFAASPSKRFGRSRGAPASPGRSQTGPARQPLRTASPGGPHVPWPRKPPPRPPSPRPPNPKRSSRKPAEAQAGRSQGRRKRGEKVDAQKAAAPKAAERPKQATKAEIYGTLPVREDRTEQESKSPSVFEAMSETISKDLGKKGPADLRGPRPAQAQGRPQGSPPPRRSKASTRSTASR